MRNLTINRDKTCVGCLMPVKFYVSDEIYGDLIIKGIKCRKIGVLANGSISTFQICNEEVVLFAIIDRISRNYCYGKKIIKAGSEDIFLSGKNKLSLFRGNPFKFYY